MHKLLPHKLEFSALGGPAILLRKLFVQHPTGLPFQGHLIIISREEVLFCFFAVKCVFDKLGGTVFVCLCALLLKSAVLS